MLHKMYLFYLFFILSISEVQTFLVHTTFFITHSKIQQDVWETIAVMPIASNEPAWESDDELLGDFLHFSFPFIKPYKLNIDYPNVCSQSGGRVRLIQSSSKRCKENCRDKSNQTYCITKYGSAVHVHRWWSPQRNKTKLFYNQNFRFNFWVRRHKTLPAFQSTYLSIRII